MRWLVVVGAVTLVEGADLLDLKDTFVALAAKERRIDSVSPNYGTTEGGTHVTIKGTGFATEFFSGSNYVLIGSGSTWVTCDVIEGACTVDCGGDKKIVCDTGAWTNDWNSGWLDVQVEIDDSIQSYFQCRNHV